MSTTGYPVHVDAHLDSHLSRGLWLVKWVLAIPHYVVLAFLWAAFVVTSVVAFFAILFTGRYPHSLFDFNVGVLRWTWRVSYYAYGALGTDRYPPFSLREDPTYPAHLEVDYPGHLSRGLVLVKWWLLAIPHYLVVALFAGSGISWAADQSADETAVWSTGLIGLLVLVAAVVLLFTGRYPQALFDFVLGMNRWVLRVAAYAALMTDDYPPFRLDQGGDDPDRGVVTRGPVSPVGPARPAPQGGTPTPYAAAPAPPPPPPSRGWTTGRVVGLVLASVLALVSLGFLSGGLALLAVDQTARDSDGFLTSGTEGLDTATYALTSASFEVWADGPGDVVPGSLVGDVRFTATGAEPVFVGIAPTDDVEAYLGGVPHETMNDLRDPGTLREGADTPAVPPGDLDIWAAQASGAGTQTMTWEVDNGRWTLVVMNADASPAVSVDMSVGAELPALDWLVPLLLSLGGTGLVVSAVALVLVIRSASKG